MPSPRPLPLIKRQKARPDLRKARQGKFSGTNSLLLAGESLAFGQFTTQDLLQSGHLPHKNSKNLLGPTYPIFFEINQGRPSLPGNITSESTQRGTADARLQATWSAMAIGPPSKYPGPSAAGGTVAVHQSSVQGTSARSCDRSATRARITVQTLRQVANVCAGRCPYRALRAF